MARHRHVHSALSAGVDHPFTADLSEIELPALLRRLLGGADRVDVALLGVAHDHRAGADDVAGAVIMKDTEEGDVFPVRTSEKVAKKSWELDF